jgi:hypothetical protein
MKKNKIIIMMLVLGFTLLSCRAALPVEEMEQMESPEPAQPQQTIEPAQAEPTPSPEPTFQGQYESGEVEVLETDRDLVVDQCEMVTAEFDQRAYGTGWVQIVSPRIMYVTQYPTGTYDDPMVTTEWYRMDREGQILEGFTWMSTLEGELLQEGVYLNGWYDGVYRNLGYSLDFDSFGPDGEIQDPTLNNTEPFRFTGGFCERLTEQDSPQVAVVSFAGVEALRFSFEDHYVNTYGQEGDHMVAMYFDRSTGTHLGTGTYEILPDGRLKALSGTVDLQYAFNADPPEDRFAEIWARVPHGDTFVPVEEGQP